MSNANLILLGSAIDRLAAVKALLATLSLEEKTLKLELVNSGLTSIDGALHHVAISHCDGKVTTDWKSIALHFTPSYQLVTAHTSQGEPFDTVRVSARVGASA